MTTSTPSAAQLQRAIADTRAVFESEPAVGEALNYLKEVLASLQTHADDLAVDRFAADMKTKLAACRAAGRQGWDDPARCDVADLVVQLITSVAKGDPVDIANFAMMAHARGASRENIGGALLEYMLANEKDENEPLPGTFANADELFEAIGVSGGANASIAEESLAGADAAPTVVVGADLAAANDKLQRDLDAVLAVLERQLQSSRSISESFTDLARRYDQQAAHVESLTAALAGALAQTNAAEQAAAAMRAESAQILADAERSAGAKMNMSLAPVTALSEEVATLARRLRQPPELVVHLLMLAEVRGMRR